MQTKHLRHQCGGRITAIHYVEHELAKNGAAYWQFRGDIEWGDGKESENVAIGPNQLCADREDPESKRECDIALGQMSDYLNHNGKWHDLKWTKDGMGYSWTPKKPKGKAVVYDPALALAPAACAL